jgi:histidine triad (HIT) family protein
MGCLFCKIVAREIPSQIIFEDDHTLAFRDVRPVAPTHALVIPKKHVVAISDTTDEDTLMLGQLMSAARKVAQQENLASGFRLVINDGPNAGQSVSHVHVHLLGGRALSWPPG